MFVLTSDSRSGSVASTVATSVAASPRVGRSATSTSVVSTRLITSFVATHQ